MMHGAGRTRPPRKYGSCPPFFGYLGEVVSRPPQDRIDFRRGLGIVVGVAAAIRLVHVFAINRSPLSAVLIGDARAYDAWARVLAGGDWLGSEVFYQAPLYPYFLGTVYALLGAAPAAARVVQALLGAAGCGLLALAGRSWFSPRTGLAAGALAAVYAPAVFFDGLLQKSTLDFLFMAALVWALGRARLSAAPAWAIAPGAVLGMFSLTRENALLLAPWIGLWFLARTSEGRRVGSAMRATLFVTGFLAVLLPVGIRNRVVGGEFVLTTMQSGTNLWFGNNPGATGRHVPLREGREMPEFERADATAIAEAAVGRQLSAREVSAWWRDRALDWIREHPIDWVLLMGRKTLMVWNRVEIPDTESIQLHADESTMLRVLSWWPAFGLLAPLAAAGVALERRRWRDLWLLYGMMAVFTGAVALFYVFARYRFPLVPLLLLFAGAAVVGAYDVLRRGDRREVGLASAAAVVTAFVVWAPVAPTADPRPLDWFNVGTAHADRGDWADAALWFRRSAEARPGEPQVRYNLGRSLEALGDPAGAEREFRETLSLDPSHVPAHNNLGVLLAQREDLAGARDAFEEAIRLEPGSALGWNNLGNVNMVQGRPAEAARLYREATARDPDWIEARVNLATALLEVGQRDEAISELRRVLEREPGREDARALLRDAGAGAD